MDSRTADFLVDFLAMYNKVAEIVPWPALRGDEGSDCPLCRAHSRDVRGARFDEVWTVTEHVFVKHGVKKSTMSYCWSIQRLISDIAFE